MRLAFCHISDSFGSCHGSWGNLPRVGLLSFLMPPHERPYNAVPIQWGSVITGANLITTSSTVNKHNMGVKSRTPNFSSRLVTPYNPPLRDISSRTFTRCARLRRNGHFGYESHINASADRKGG